MRNGWIDGIFCNIAFYTEIVISFSFVFRKGPPLIFHFAGCLPGTCDNFSYTSHCLGIGTHHTENSHVVKNVFRCNGLRTDTGVCKSHVLRNFFVQMVAYHQHVQMLVQRIYRIRHGRVCRRWQNISCGSSTDNVRCMSAAGTLCMVSMDGSSTDGSKSIFHTSTLI